MKHIVLKFGLISGALMSLMMLMTVPFMDRIGFDYGMLIGYTTMTIAFLLVYFGVRSYRDKVIGGTIGFGRAFLVGILIATVSSMCYVATWQVVYFNFTPNFMDNFKAHALDKARRDGASEEVIAAQSAEIDKFAVQYDNPLFNAAVTFLEPLPVALIVALGSAGVLSRRRKVIVDARHGT